MEVDPVVGTFLGHPGVARVQQLWLVHAARRTAHLHETDPAFQHQRGQICKFSPLFEEIII
jgi:hypothetical protein